MKRTILNILFCVFSAAVLIGGSVFAAYMHDYHTVHYDRYHEVYFFLTVHGEAAEGGENDQRIKFPQYFWNFDDIRVEDVDPNLAHRECYQEINDACFDYVQTIAYRYLKNADLDFTVDLTKDTMTIEFFGTGYPENGEPEPISQTFIFDIEGTGAEKIPRLINRADLIGY